jgi:hypothetical protein
MIEKVRRVVIGARPGETSSFTHVEEVEPVDSPDGALKQWLVWGWEKLPMVPSVDRAPGYEPQVGPPPSGGLRVITIRGSGDTGPAMEGVGDSLPGFRHDDSRPGMHSTETVDVAVVIEGEPMIEAEDGTRETLKPGDVYVVNGAMHRWHYDAENPSTLVFFAFGAESGA